MPKLPDGTHRVWKKYLKEAKMMRRLHKHGENIAASPPTHARTPFGTAFVTTVIASNIIFSTVYHNHLAHHASSINCFPTSSASSYVRAKGTRLRWWCFHSDLFIALHSIQYLSTIHTAQFRPSIHTAPKHLRYTQHQHVLRYTQHQSTLIKTQNQKRLYHETGLFTFPTRHTVLPGFEFAATVIPIVFPWWSPVQPYSIERNFKLYKHSTKPKYGIRPSLYYFPLFVLCNGHFSVFSHV